MNIVECIRSSFKITNKYIILATPLILFSLISSLYLFFSINGSVASVIVAIILFMLMSAAFIAGWAYMIKKVVINPENEDIQELIKEFPAGVGEYFLPSIGFVVNLFLVSSLLLIIFYYIGMHFIGNIGVDADAMGNAMGTPETLRNFWLSLNVEQQTKLTSWNLLLFVQMIIESFILMFYLPTFLFKTHNPFIALGVNLKDLFGRNFFKNWGLFVIIFVSYFALSVMKTVLGSYIVMNFILNLVSFYYFVLVAVLIFNYYYQNYVKLGGNIDEVV